VWLSNGARCEERPCSVRPCIYSKRGIQVAAFASKNSKFKAIDAAIGRNGFKVVTLLRMSPLLPLAASSYLYGLTSVDLGSYVLGSWLGMLPGTVAYVAAGELTTIPVTLKAPRHLPWFSYHVRAPTACLSFSNCTCASNVCHRQ
jgi:uncharacterized membrane protein YdjX (TVP38/TMEM64 family)